MTDTKIEITINDRKLSVAPRTTILQAAINNGIYIPHICFDRRLTPYGGCRLCLVEVEGSPKLMAACTTPATKGMIVRTESEKLSKARRTVLELMLVHHPLDCIICDKAGECDLQDLAYKYGPSQVRFKGQRKHGPELTAAPLVERNPNRCIYCGKCVRICTEHQGVAAISLIGKGFKTFISPAFEETLDCEFCGQCIDVCPVGALGSKPFRYRTRVWYMNEQDNICPYCGCGCTVTLGLRDGRIQRSRGKARAGISQGDLCGRGRYGYDFLYSDKRLTKPLIRKEGQLAEVSWEEALTFIAKRLKEITAKHGPAAVGAIGSQRCGVEDNYALQRFMRMCVGSNNIDSLARFGYARVQGAVKKTYGLNALPMEFDSPLKAKAILVVDSDITSTQPVFGLNIIRAARDFGARLIVADPKMTKLARHADEWLRPKAGSAVPLLMSMAKTALDEGLAAPNAAQTPNFEAFKQSLEGFTAEEIGPRIDLEPQWIKQATRSFAATPKRILAMTLTDSENQKGSDAVLAAANLLTLLGSGPSALQLPTEYSNTLGMFEAGVRPDAGPNHQPQQGPAGLDAQQMLYDDASPIKAMYIMGGNPLVTFPDSSKVRQALEKLELLIVQDILMGDTVELAHVVLPASAWGEKDSTLVAATGQAQHSVQCLPSVGEARPDWRIFLDLARAMGKDMAIDGLDAIRERIKRDVPLKWDMEKANVSFVPVKVSATEPDAEFPMSMTIGVLMQHSGSLSTISKSLGTVALDAYALLNKDEAHRMGIVNDHYVRVVARSGELFLRARLTDEVPEGMVFVPGHFPQARINNLTLPPVEGQHRLVPVKVEVA